MKKAKLLCLGVILALAAVTTSNYTTANASTAPLLTGQTITVKDGGITLKDAIDSAKSGDTIVVSGTVKSGTINVPAGVTIQGDDNGKIDFSLTNFGEKGLNIKTDGSTIENLEICNAGDNGIFIEGSHNNLININVHDNQDAGVQISNGGSYNYFNAVTSQLNADPKGENADGFAIKLHSGEGNVLENCISKNNSDDGYDLYAAHGAVKFIRCQALNNGECKGIKGDGNGFKVGGVDNKTPGVLAHLDPLEHTLIDCIAKGNSANGFDRNNQSGVVTMLRCVSDSNGGKNYAFPLTGTPSALGYKVTFGKAIIQDSRSINGINKIDGATLVGACTGF